MQDSFVDTILPQLATGSAHTSALGFVFDGLHEGDPRIRVPWRPDLVGDPDTGVLAGGLVTTLLDHIGGLAVWTTMAEFQPIATLDLRVDYMRAAHPRVDLLAQGKCYRLTPTIAFDDFVALRGEAKAREAGKLRAEGKTYVVKDGDVMNFLFN